MRFEARANDSRGDETRSEQEQHGRYRLREKDPLSHDGWRGSGGEFTGDRLRHQDLAVEPPEKFDVFEED
jgi:hypothetical protein